MPPARYFPAAGRRLGEETDIMTASSGPATGSRLRTIAANSLIVLISILVTYVIVEAIFFWMLFPVLKPSVRPQVHGTPGVLTQHTIASYEPRRYIAILGDSMAEGLGDTLVEAGYNVERAFHAAHALHQLTGRDVVSFGRGGAGNAESLVRQTAQITVGSRCYFFPTLEDPAQIFAYFYEGNDIQDNLRFAARVTRAFGRADDAAIDAVLIGDYAAFPRWRCHGYFLDIANRMTRLLYRYYRYGSQSTPEPPGPNVLRVAGRVVNGPAGMEAPALEVDRKDIDTGMKVFERSLRWLRQRFPNVPITVVYIPAALSMYQLDGTTYVFPHEPREAGRSGQTTPAAIARNSNLLCNLVRAVAMNYGAGFLDTRPELRRAAASRVLHGPIDWIHFNRDGYQILGEILAKRMDDTQRVDTCGNPPAGQ
jgi:hypothetical protein